MSKTHKAEFRVYYEDTDAGGVVYYANYLKFAERARTEMLRDWGLNQSELAQKENIVFVVRHAEIDLKSPAKLDDCVSVTTAIDKIAGASLIMNQKLAVGDVEVANVKVKVACVSKDFKPTKLPENIKDNLV